MKVNKKKRSKSRKKSKKSRRTKTQKGGTESIDLHQIILTSNISDAILKYNQYINLSQFKISDSFGQDFPLNRMDNIIAMNPQDFDKLINTYDVIDLQPLRNDAGKLIAVTINGERKQAYKILNGRHRIARAILENKQYIIANIK